MPVTPAPPHSHVGPSNQELTKCGKILKKILNAVYGNDKDKGKLKREKDQEDSPCDPSTLFGKFTWQEHQKHIDNLASSSSDNLDKFKSEGCDKHFGKLSNVNSQNKKLSEIETDAKEKKLSWKGNGDIERCKKSKESYLKKNDNVMERWKKFQESSVAAKEVAPLIPVAVGVPAAVEGIGVVLEEIAIILLPFGI